VGIGRAAKCRRVKVGCDPEKQAKKNVCGDGTDVRLRRSNRRKLERAMGSTMPFSKLQLDPEHIEAMHDAFRRVCDILQLSCDREDPLTEIVVLKIMELAKSGQRDPEILCIDVLAELEAPSQRGTSSVETDHICSGARGGGMT
jgi:hypothetical protein